jgi:hypothetical protein
VIVLAVEGSQLGIEVHADAGEDAAQGVLDRFREDRAAQVALTSRKGIYESEPRNFGLDGFKGNQAL